MFLVEKPHLKPHLSSHFRSITKKSSHLPKNYQLAARSFDDKLILHLQTLDPPLNSSAISLSWLSAAVSFLSKVHTEAHDLISKLRSEADDYQAFYIDYSMKVLDLCNLVSSAVQQFTNRRLLMNLSIRLLLNSSGSGQMPSPEKLNKAKDALTRSVNNTRESAPEKGLRAKALIGELAVALGRLPRGKTSSERDLIRRTFYALGVSTVFVADVLVSVLYGQSGVEVRVPAEFGWADSVNGLRAQIFDLINQKEGSLLEVEEMERRARDVLDGVVSGKDGMENGVKELETAVRKFSDGVDGLTDGVNGLFNAVLKTRNGVLDGCRMGPL